MFTKTTFFDYLVIFLFLVVSVLSFKILKDKSSNELVVKILQQNNLIYKDKLSKEKEIQLKNAVIEIKNKKVRVKTSNCPFQVCVHTGWISNAYQQIICIPNKIYISIEPLSLKKIDSITY
ncbi:MAG: NusG domain II-containing protein [Elusimicrobiota bacterium]|nr:NusG domain II-containing protein [Endomicrobiia bacterium]MCX7910297.1 NusG domain II-containing protein [Endomicrobiia bacterium]MDW8165771.1 NusG domain II-containing protein [Elusimicrobiota bacterium]